VFIGATDDFRFRALDARTGKELWVVKLNGSVGAVPITYQGADGKQYVVANATGVYGSSPTSDEIVAFRLK
jgi:quinoprotein glucose dehydrogenase